MANGTPVTIPSFLSRRVAAVVSAAAGSDVAAFRRAAAELRQGARLGMRDVCPCCVVAAVVDGRFSIETADERLARLA